MISVEFTSAGPGTCGWCQKERDEVFTVAFSDKSFGGPLCKNDLLRAIRMKCQRGVAPVPLAQAVKPNGNVPATVK